MPIEIPSAARCAAANAARAKAAIKHKIAAYITDHYAATKQGVCGCDLIAEMKLSKDSAYRSLRELVAMGKIHCIGLSGDTERTDIANNISVYAPMDAPMLQRRVVKARVPRVVVRVSESKPPPLSAPRVKAAPYRGEIGRQYVPEFKPSSGREFWLARDLALLAR